MGIKFFKKSVYDLSNTLPETTVTDATASNTGEAFTDFMRNRSNSSGWATTGSVDAANTTIEIDFNDLKEFNRIMLLGHNLKAFTLKYWDGSSWVDFSTPISETTNTAGSNYYEFDLVESRYLQLIITGTMTADADKTIKQILVCEFLGELSFEPEVDIEFTKQRKRTAYLSGKSFVSSQVGGFSCRLRHPTIENESDFSLIEELFDAYEGFHISISGGTETQFSTVRPGYRLEDIYFVNLANEYRPSFLNGRWKNGIPIDMVLVEVN